MGSATGFMYVQGDGKAAANGEGKLCRQGEGNRKKVMPRILQPWAACPSSNFSFDMKQIRETVWIMTSTVTDKWNKVVFCLWLLYTIIFTHCLFTYLQHFNSIFIYIMKKKSLVRLPLFVWRKHGVTTLKKGNLRPKSHFVPMQK